MKKIIIVLLIAFTSCQDDAFVKYNYQILKMEDKYCGLPEPCSGIVQSWIENDVSLQELQMKYKDYKKLDNKGNKTYEVTYKFTKWH
jgi:hypothetical protein